MSTKKQDVVKDPQDQTTKELIATIMSLSKQVTDANQSRKWHDAIQKTNEDFQTRSAQWNSFTLMGRITIVNKEKEVNAIQNYWITLDDTHYCMEGQHDYDVGDIVLVIGRITGHAAHDEETRGYYYGADRIYVQPYESKLISKGENLTFDPNNPEINQ